MIDSVIDEHLSKKIEALKAVTVPQERSFGKSLFMTTTGVLAETGLITHDQRFEWNEKMLKEVG